MRLQNKVENICLLFECSGWRLTERAVLVNGVISRGGTRLVRIDHPTQTVDGEYHGNYLGWLNRSKFLLDVMEVRGGAKYIDQVRKNTSFFLKINVSLNLFLCFQWTKTESQGMVRGVRRRTLQDDMDDGIHQVMTPYQLQMRLNRRDFDLRFYERR